MGPKIQAYHDAISKEVRDKVNEYKKFKINKDERKQNNPIKTIQETKMIK